MLLFKYNLKKPPHIISFPNNDNYNIQDFWMELQKYFHEQVMFAFHLKNKLKNRKKEIYLVK